MAHLEDKIAEIADPALRQAIADEVARLKKRTRFGLVFEEHQPEVIPINNARIKRGERVALRTGNLAEIWRVLSVRDGLAHCEKDKDATVREIFDEKQLIVVRRMGEPIYPALTPIDAVKNGDPSQPHHILIEADNYHALQLLLFAYDSKVDCIYIDPPYNTGARDWKYNNNYVDSNDAWQHSKWLTFMAKRLRLAKRLLKPCTGVLIVTIDKNELHHLGMLLGGLFPDAKRQMVTICINPSGTSGEGFSRVEEYALFCFLGVAEPVPVTDDLLLPPSGKKSRHIRWESLMRGGTVWYRKERDNLCYPVVLDESSQFIVDVGEPLPFHDNEPLDLQEEANRPLKVGKNPLAWPLRNDGRLGIWRVENQTLKRLAEKGYAYVSSQDTERGTWTIRYLMAGTVLAIERGEILIEGRGDRGQALLKRLESKLTVAKTMWVRGRHTAGGGGGTTLVADVLQRRSTFSFPKSIYSTKDAIQVGIGDRKEALIIDFFAGSGTTLNAVNLLNAADGGARQCILVTNNEVSEEEARNLSAQGLQPGQDEWDQYGICRSVTWPRSKFTILGRRDDGTLLPGDYLTGKQVTREKPRSIRQLGFAEGRYLSVPQRKQVAALLPAVPQSKVDGEAWFLDDEIGVSVLWDVQQASSWLEELTDADHVTEVCVVTMEGRLFNALKAQIIETLGPQVVSEDEKRPLAAGFAANLEYFRLDFLDPQEIQMGRQFAAILPLLWMMAGARGPRPEPPDPHAPWLLPAGCPFAVLMQETRFKDFSRHVEARDDLTHLFVVTNSADTVYKLCKEWPNHRVVQLYKDYLENFRINLTETPAP